MPVKKATKKRPANSANTRSKKRAKENKPQHSHAPTRDKQKKEFRENLGKISPDKSVGIDIGSTNSALAVMADGRLTEVSFPSEGVQLRSAVYWDEDAEPIAGKQATRSAYKNGERYYTHFKRRLHDDAQSPAYGGHSAIELTAILIAKIVKVLLLSMQDVGEYLNGKKAREKLVVTLTHPASWGVQQLEHLREAAAAAGLEVDTFMPEPCAAAYRLLEETSSRIQQNDLMAVLDFGGGTFDLILLRYDRGSWNAVSGASGNPTLGGDNITGVIFVHLSTSLGLGLEECFDEKLGLNINAQSLTSQQQRVFAIELWDTACELKEQLASTDRATAFFSGPNGPEEVSLDLDTYWELTESIWNAFRDAIRTMLAGTEITFAEVDHIGLVGGSAMARGAVHHAAAETGKPESNILVSSSSSHVVASGAAIASFGQQQGDAYVGRGLGLQMRAVGGTSHTNKMFVSDDTVLKSSDQTFYDLGQSIRSQGGRSVLRIQPVEAKPGVKVAKPTDGVPTLLDDVEVSQLLAIDREIEIPPGDHEVRIGFSNSNGRVFYHIGFEDPGIEGITGLLEATGPESPTTPKQEIDLVLLVDTSSSMQGSKFNNAANAIEDVINQTSASGVRVAIITFGQQTGVLCPFGTGPIEAISAVNAITPSGGTPLDKAFALAIEAVQKERPAAHKLVIAVTDGHPHDANRAAVAATSLKDCAELVCFGIGQDVDDGYLTRLATSPDHYFYTDDPTRIPALFDQILELYLN